MPLRNAGAGALLVVVVLAISALVPAPAAAGEGLPAHPPAAPLPAPDLAPDAADPVFIHFDTETAGTRIAEKYASQGLHFLNDYQARPPVSLEPPDPGPSQRPHLAPRLGQ